MAEVISEDFEPIEVPEVVEVPGVDEVLSVVDESIVTDTNENTEVSDAVDSGSESVDWSSIQANQETIIMHLQEIQDNTDHFVYASDTVTTYGVVFVPLILICTMLWWFFRQFISSYR